MWELRFCAYCGMAETIAKGDKEEIKNAILARFKRARKMGIPVSRIDKGKWEFETPDDAFGISDNEGIMYIRKVRRNRR